MAWNEGAEALGGLGCNDDRKQCFGWWPPRVTFSAMPSGGHLPQFRSKDKKESKMNQMSSNTKEIVLLAIAYAVLYATILSFGVTPFASAVGAGLALVGFSAIWRLFTLLLR